MYHLYTEKQLLELVVLALASGIQVFGQFWDAQGYRFLRIG